MTALTENRNTQELLGARNYPVNFVIADSVICYAGAIAAYNKSTEKVVPASDSANLVVLGRSPEQLSSGDNINPEKGIFQYANSSGNPVTREHIGKACYVVDDQTVASTPGTNGVIAGKVYDVDSNGVYVDMRDVKLTNVFGDMTIEDGKDFALGTSTGTKLGTAADQKLGFYGGTPVVQPDNIAPIGITYTANDPSYTPSGSLTIADGSAPTVTELLQLILEVNAKANALVTNQETLGLSAESE